MTLGRSHFNIIFMARNISGLITFIFLLSVIVTSQDKLKVEDVVLRHLDSIGTVEKRKAIKNRMISGPVLFHVLKDSSGAAVGRSILISEDQRNFFGAVFDTAAYPAEEIAFDGEKVSVSFITPGNRSPLGNFIFAHKSIVSTGLLTGSLSSSWPLLSPPTDKGKLRLAGRKKINGRDVYLLDYLPKGGSDLETRIFIDAETFHHVRTEYSQMISAAQGLRPEDSSSELESRYRLTEDFSDFRDEGGITLPHSYSVLLSLARPSGTNEYEWKFELARFAFNQNLDPDLFRIRSE